MRQQALRASLLQTAIELIAREGFDAVTVTQIAEGAGTSRRTFFRYFDSKDDVVFDWLDQLGDFVLGQLLLDSRSTPAMQRLRDALIALGRHLDDDRKRAILMTRVVFDTPTLSRRWRAENSRWEGEAEQVLARGRTGDDNLELKVLVSAATATFFTTLRAWSESDHQKSIETWVRTGFKHLLESS